MTLMDTRNELVENPLSTSTRLMTGRVSRSQVRPAKRKNEGVDVEDLLSALHTLVPGTPEFIRTRELVVVRCLPLADRVARHFSGRGQNVEDLVQVARIGLMHAVNRFDPEKGCSFTAFAVPTMMGELRRHFRDYGWTMHVPRSLRDRHVEMGQATAELTQTLGRSPTPTELAEAMQIDRAEVIDSVLAANAYEPQSLDAEQAGPSGSVQRLGDLLGDVDPRVERITDREAVRPILAALPERQRTILYLRFFESMTQKQIAAHVGVSQMHVSRILERTLQEIRQQLQ